MNQSKNRSDMSSDFMLAKQLDNGKKANNNNSNNNINQNDDNGGKNNLCSYIKTKTTTITEKGKGDNALKYFPSSVNIGIEFNNNKSYDEQPKVSLLQIPPQIRRQQKIIRGDTEKYSNISDLCCISLLCTRHRRMALVEVDHNNKGALFLPFEKFQLSNITIDQALNSAIRKVVDIQSGN